MANDSFPRGLFPLRLLQATPYKANTAADIFLGMPVALGADGLVAPANATTGGGVQFLGAAIGFSDGNKGSIATADPFLDVSDLGSDKEPYVLVADAPQQEFIVQEDTGGSALVQADIGLIYTMVYGTGSGNTNTGWTNLELDRSTGLTGTAGQIMLLRLHDGVNSDGTVNTTGNYAKYVAKIVHHQKNVGIVANPGPTV